MRRRESFVREEKLIKIPSKSADEEEGKKSKKLVKSLPGGMHLIAVHLWASHENF
jgi:hypothetical protein